MRLTGAKVAFFAALSLASARVQADQPILHGIDGKCRIARLGREPLSCDGMLAIMTQNGRSVYFMKMKRSHGTALMVFRGDRDEQPTLDHYTLFLNEVGLALDGGKIENYPAEGKCEGNMSDDGSFSRMQHCKAVTGGGLEMELEVGPGPIK